MSYYDNDNAWSNQGRNLSWNSQADPRTGVNSSNAHQAEPNAFASQFEEIARATDNLTRSGKWFAGQAQNAGPSSQGRRESMPVVGRGSEFSPDNRSSSSSQSRHHSSNSEHDGMRPGSAGLQGFYAGQRFPSRQSEAEQVLQAKRRMAAQRERELRNYHQEQQYNRNSSSAKSDRSMSPNTMSEEDRRDLIARQHRALYGDNSNLYNPNDANRHKGQDSRSAGPGRGQSPLNFDRYNQAQAGAENVQMPARPESTTSPVSASTTQPSLNAINDAQQSSRTSTSSPGATSPPLQGGVKTGVAPIGTRPPQVSAVASNKRSTTPLTPSSLSYGFSGTEQGPNTNKDERSTSAASNPSIPNNSLGGNGSWGTNSGVWGKNNLGNQASVWG